MDKLAQLVRKKIELTDKIVEVKVGSDEFINAYNEYKSILDYEVDATWETIKKMYSDKQEACYYKVLDGFYVTTLNFDIGMTAEKLAGLMLVDEGFKYYCKIQARTRDSFGNLRFERKLAQTEIIEAALKLL
jgi:hypothetical protein